MGRRILLVAPLVAPIAASQGQLGGAQVVVADLAAGLARRGHAVSLIAARGSHVDGVRTVDLDIDAGELRPASLAHVTDFDAVHAHAFDAPAFEALRGMRVRVVHTLHLPPTDPSVVAAAAASHGGTCSAPGGSRRKRGPTS